MLAFDTWVTLAALFACVPVLWSGCEISRWEGGVFLGYCVVYVSCLVLGSLHHDSLPVLSSVMLGLFAPLTIITFAVVMLGGKERSGSGTQQVDEVCRNTVAGGMRRVAR